MNTAAVTSIALRRDRQATLRRVVARTSGTLLLAMAAMGALYMRAMYYSARRRLPGPAEQLQYFVLLVLALGLFAAALFVAEPGANPDYRPPAHSR